MALFENTVAVCVGFTGGLFLCCSYVACFAFQSVYFDGGVKVIHDY
jgi:hypothetical protein